mmetsp:Transcript_71168/g.208597  ORF Transcript_71168/g.208597 Transcript_71168/m.208597 type:complete len:102 (-) Transcript_71168:24-329(-)
MPLAAAIGLFRTEALRADSCADRPRGVLVVVGMAWRIVLAGAANPVVLAEACSISAVAPAPPQTTPQERALLWPFGTHAVLLCEAILRSRENEGLCARGKR